MLGRCDQSDAAVDAEKRRRRWLWTAAVVWLWGGSEVGGVMCN